MDQKPLRVARFSEERRSSEGYQRGKLLRWARRVIKTWAREGRDAVNA